MWSILPLVAACHTVLADGLSARSTHMGGVAPVDPDSIDKELRPFARPCTQRDWESKDLDLVIYGATGSVGRLAAGYVAKGHRESPRWAVANHKPGNMFSLRSMLMKMPNPPSAHFFADLTREGDGIKILDRVVNRTRAIISFAGPYEKHGGEELIRAALRSCAHYVDVSTETAWNAEMLRKYEVMAEVRGVAVVQSAGAEALPTDLLAVLAADKMAADGMGPPSTVRVVWTRRNGRPTGGGLATASFLATHRRDNSDPYILVPQKASKKKTDPTPAGAEQYGPDLFTLTVTGRSPGAEVGAPVARRSLFHRFPQYPVSVVEALSVPAIARSSLKFAARQGSTPFSPELMESEGSLVGYCLAMRDYRLVRASLRCRGDPHSLGTAKMSTELALGLARRPPPTPTGGYLTPALALGGDPLALVRRLQAAGGESPGENFMNISDIMFDMDGLFRMGEMPMPH